MKYHLCEAVIVGAFISEINEFLSQGWKLHGPTYTVGNVHYQALILETKL